MSKVPLEDEKNVLYIIPHIITTVAISNSLF